MYQAIYKCRLCGELFRLGKQKKSNAKKTAEGLTKFESYMSDLEFNRYQIHKCRDGSFGFGDFQGFKKLENGK